MYNKYKNINILMDLERMKGDTIQNISQYNHAVQRQVIQHQQKMQIIKYKNDNQSQSVIQYNSLKSNCGSC
jgi:ABC-type Fe2+-enterobactin transport system substrate-binding protein